MPLLQHGTTRQRAESVEKNGPNPHFVEPNGYSPAGGFSTAPANGPFFLGSPQQYAEGKARLFPQEGGPAIIEVEVPDLIAALAIRAGGEFRFEAGWGLEELLEAWSTLTKRIIIP